MSNVRKMVLMRICVGCGQCEALCTDGAITMMDGELGFPVPSVDEEKCTRCGKCIKSCPFSDGCEEDD